MLDPAGGVCADLGCSTGGFTDCWLWHGAARVYAVDTGYGVLDYKLRKDPRVVVMERQNAMHVTLPEPADFASIDVAWTRQRHILPAARRVVRPGGLVVSLVKPHYEAQAAQLHKGVLPPEAVDAVAGRVLAGVGEHGFELLGEVRSPILGAKGNIELLALLRRTGSPLP